MSIFSNICPNFSCPDLAFSVTLPYIARPLTHSFDEVIKKSKLSATPFFVGIILTGIAAISLESLIRLAVAISVSPLSLGAFSYFGEKGRELAKVPIQVLGSVEINLLFGFMFICCAFEAMYKREEFEMNHDSFNFIQNMKYESIILSHIK